MCKVLRPTRHSIGHFTKTHINTTQIKEKKQLNIQQKQNYPGSVASYNSRPGNEVGQFYKGPECHTGRTHSSFGTVGIEMPAAPGGTKRRHCYGLIPPSLTINTNALPLSIESNVAFAHHNVVQN